MAKGDIRKYLYRAIIRASAAPFYMVSFPLLCFDFLNDLVWKPKNIDNSLKCIISAPLVILFLLVAIPSAILASLVTGTLVIANVILFPDLFFPLWIKGGVNLSRVFSIYLSYQLHAINFEDFLKLKNNNRELLVELLKSNNLNVQDVISFHKDYSELVKSIITEIHDKEKSKIIFNYLELSNVKLLIAQDTYSQHYPHKVYKTCKNNIKVINDVDIRLLKALIKLDRHSASKSSSGMRATKLSNIIHLLKDHYLAKNISDTFSSNTQSSLIKIIQYFLPKIMEREEFTLFTSMLQNKNVLENLKRIDNINNILPDTFTSEDPSSFLNLRKIFCNHTTYCSINNLHSLLSNNRLFNKLDSIPIKVLKDICSTKLYIACRNTNEVLAFFDCLDDNKKNKNIIDNLKTAFETDSEATLAFLNNELFNSQDEILEVIGSKKFDGHKVRNILNRINLIYTLRENGLIYTSSGTTKTIYIFNLWYIIHVFCKNIKVYLSLNEPYSDLQEKNTFLHNVDLFRFLLRETAGCRYEKVLSIIKDTRMKHFNDGRFISQVGYNLKDYFAHLLIFQGVLFSDISNEFRLRVMYILFPLFRPERGPQPTMEKCCKRIFKMKFVELFEKQKYEKITQESLEKIKNLTIEDLLKVPGIEELIKMEEIEKFLHTKGITNSSDLSLLAELIKNCICIVDKMNNTLNSEENKIHTICDVFQAGPHLEPVHFLDLYKINLMRNSLGNEPSSLLNLCKISIIRSSLDQHTVSQLT